MRRPWWSKTPCPAWWAEDLGRARIPHHSRWVRLWLWCSPRPSLPDKTPEPVGSLRSEDRCPQPPPRKCRWRGVPWPQHATGDSDCHPQGFSRGQDSYSQPGSWAQAHWRLPESSPDLRSGFHRSQWVPAPHQARRRSRSKWSNSAPHPPRQSCCFSHR